MRLSRDDFTAQYAKRTNWQIGDVANAGMIALPCNCYNAGCTGWYMASVELLAAWDYRDVPEEYKQEALLIAAKRAEARR